VPGGLPPLAVGVYETELVIVWRAVSSPIADVVVLDRLADDPQPLFPLGRALWLVVGVQQEFPAERAASTLRLQPAKGELVQRRRGLRASPFGPVLGEGRIVGRRRARDQSVPDDLGPYQPDQVGAAVAVAEHPPVGPGRVELAEVPVNDPGLRLVRVCAQRPLVGQSPQVVIHGGEHLFGHHAPVVRSPSPHDRVDRADHRHSVGPTQGPQLGGEPPPDPPDGLLAGLDQQLVVGIAADVEPQEIEPLGQVDDLGLGLVEAKTPGRQPPGELRLNLLCLATAVTHGEQSTSTGVPETVWAASLPSRW